MSKQTFFVQKNGLLDQKFEPAVFILVFLENFLSNDLSHHSLVHLFHLAVSVGTCAEDMLGGCHLFTALSAFLKKRSYGSYGNVDPAVHNGGCGNYYRIVHAELRMGIVVIIS